MSTTHEIATTGLLPNVQEFTMFQTIAKNAQESGLYAGIGGQAKIFMILLAARELGVSPMLALNGGIWNIQGRIEISARLMNSLIRRAGHTMSISSTDKECVIKGKRSDTGEEQIERFTWAMAEKAGLTKNNVWQKYPEDMLYNRCMSRLARRLYPDVIGSSYLQGECSDDKFSDKLPVSECEVRQSITAREEEIVENIAPTVVSLTIEHLEDIEKMSEKVDPKYIENLKAYMLKTYGSSNFAELPDTTYKSFKTSMLNNIKINEERVSNETH